MLCLTLAVMYYSTPIPKISYLKYVFDNELKYNIIKKIIFHKMALKLLRNTCQRSPLGSMQDGMAVARSMGFLMVIQGGMQDGMAAAGSDRLVFSW